LETIIIMFDKNKLYLNFKLELLTGLG
jgi:hypothetical protein